MAIALPVTIPATASVAQAAANSRQVQEAVDPISVLLAHPSAGLPPRISEALGMVSREYLQQWLFDGGGGQAELPVADLLRR